MNTINGIEPSVTSHLLMIRPRHFGFNEETAQNNTFQINDKTLSEQQISALALKEFDDFVAVLQHAGLRITVVEDKDSPILSDAVFPNNWFSTHADGTVITYPMFSKRRRLERREDIFENLSRHYYISNRIHFEEAENKHQFLEGTGSLILDRPNKIGYACRSIRTDDSLLKEWAGKMGYSLCVFNAQDENGIAIYHTNVMMALGEQFVIWGGESVTDKKERETVEKRLSDTGKIIIPITNQQISLFAGNMLAVKNRNGDSLLIMSQTAYDSLSQGQINQIESFSKIIRGNIPVIEKYGGGSVRCMLAEIYLEKLK